MVHLCLNPARPGCVATHTPRPGPHAVQARRSTLGRRDDFPNRFHILLKSDIRNMALVWPRTLNRPTQSPHTIQPSCRHALLELLSVYHN